LPDQGAINWALPTALQPVQKRRQFPRRLLGICKEGVANIMSDLIEAADLLDADLVWSPDMDTIRYHLSSMLRAIAECRSPDHYATDLAKVLIDEHHNDISLG
jgi:hypothetical protein